MDINNSSKFYMIRNFPGAVDSEKTIAPYRVKDEIYGNRMYTTIMSIKEDHIINKVIGVHLIDNNSA